MWRLAIVGLVGTPALREFYDYTTNPRRKKIGNNAFLMITIVIFELGIIAKFGVGEFPVLVPMKVRKGKAVPACALWLVGGVGVDVRWLRVEHAETLAAMVRLRKGWDVGR